jgi:formyltetrahydrofolate synthetase
MNKLVLFVLILCGSINSYSQNLAEKANKSLTQAEKATIELSKIYDFSSDQAYKVKAIQQDKYQALVQLEALKSQDIKKYLDKRISTFEVADNELMAILDERQMKIFKGKLAEKSTQYAALLTTMKKEGASEKDILLKLSEMEF